MPAIAYRVARTLVRDEVLGILLVFDVITQFEEVADNVGVQEIRISHPVTAILPILVIEPVWPFG